MPDAAVKPAPPPRRWSRRILRWLGVVLVVVLIFRVVLALLLPLTIRRVARAYGFDASYEKSEINLLIGDAALWHLKLTPRGATEPAIQAGYVRANISTLKLLMLQLEIWRLEADGAEVEIDRHADGRIPLLDQVLAALPARSPRSESKPLLLDLSSPFRIEAARLQGTKLIFRDQSVSPPLAATVMVNARISDLRSAIRPTTFAVDVWSEPGLDLLHVEGTGRSDQQNLSAVASLELRGLDLHPLQQYLKPLGLSSSDRSIDAGGKATVNAKTSPDRKSLSGRIVIDDIRATADRDEFAGVKSVSIDIASLDTLGLKLDKVRITEARAAAARSPQGRPAIASIEYVGGGGSSNSGIAPQAATAPATAGTPFTISANEITVENSRISFIDLATEPAARLSGVLTSLDVRNVILDPRASNTGTFTGQFAAPGLVGGGTIEGTFALTGPAPSLSTKVHLEAIKPDAVQPYLPAALVSAMREGNATLDLSNLPLSWPQQSGTLGNISAELAAPGVARQLKLDGTVGRREGAIQVDLSFNGAGISADAFAELLKKLGIEPMLEDGRFSGKSTITLLPSDNAISIGLDARQLVYADGDRELAGLDSIKIDRVVVGDQLAVGTITINHPRISASRDKEGTISAAGMRFVGAPASRVATSAPASTQPTTAPASSLQFALGGIHINNAELNWSDQAGPAPLELSAVANVALTNLSFADGAVPASLDADLKSPGLMDSLRVTGQITTQPDQLAAKLKVDGAGFQGEKLASLLPAGTTPTIRDGAFAATIDANVNRAAAGGFAARAELRDVALKDGDKDLFAMQRFTAAASRIDPDANVIAIDEISTAGVQLDADISADGKLSLLGVSLGAAPPTTQPAPQPAIRVASEATTRPTEDVGALVAAAREAMPLITLGKLDLRLDRLRVAHELDHGAAPVVVENLALTNTAPITVGGENSQANPPIHLSVDGRVTPAVGSMSAVVEATPFAPQPTARLQINATGIRGQSITEIFPSLTKYIDGQRLSDGRFATAVEAQLQPDRRGGQPDYTRGFGADVQIHGTALTNGAGGPILAGVESVQATGVRVEPAGGNVIIKSLEITKPSARIFKDEAGIEAFGIVARVLAAPATQPSETPPAPAASPTGKDETATSDSRGGESFQPTTQLASASGEIRVDKLIISGLDVLVEDRTVNPPIMLPLNGLDLDAAGLSNHLLSDARPIRFNAVVTSGKVPLPTHTYGGIAGALGDVGKILGGKEKELATRPAEEDRELFSQAAASGRFALYPKPTGWIKASVNGLELTALRGFASAAGVTISNGVVDSSIDARFRDDSDVIDARTRTVLTDLQVTEPANGPISRQFKAPLDVIISALQDADDSITLPVNVSIKQGELDKGAIFGSAMGAAGGVIAAAIASTPVKVVSGVGNLLGGEKDKKPKEPRTVPVGFAAGDASISQAEMARLKPILEQLRKDKNLELTLRHELTAADVAIAAERANPSPSDALAIAQRLRHRRDALLQQRATAAALAKSQIASTDSRASASAIDALRDLDRQIAQAESSLDSILEQLKPGADRQSGRRTRAAALELGRQRMDVLRQALIETKARDAADRVRVVNPTFAPNDSKEAGGTVVITLIEKKK